MPPIGLGLALQLEIRLGPRPTAYRSSAPQTPSVARNVRRRNGEYEYVAPGLASTETHRSQIFFKDTRRNGPIDDERLERGDSGCARPPATIARYLYHDRYRRAPATE